MPGKDEIFAKLLFLINSPAQRLVTVLNAAGRDLAVVINQGVKENKFAGGPAPAAIEAPAEPAVEVQNRLRPEVSGFASSASVRSGSGH